MKEEGIQNEKKLLSFIGEQQEKTLSRLE